MCSDNLNRDQIIVKIIKKDNVIDIKYIYTYIYIN